MKTETVEQIPKLKPYVIQPELDIYDLGYHHSYKFPVNFGHGIRWKDKEGQTWESFVRQGDFQNGKRRVYRCWSSYVGSLSFGASHYYGTIKVYSSSIKCIETGETLSMGGYGPERDKIEGYIRGINIQVQRVLIKLEKCLNDELLGKIGDRTYRFNSEQEAKEAGTKTFLERFEPGWILIDEDDCDVVLAET